MRRVYEAWPPTALVAEVVCMPHQPGDATVPESSQGKVALMSATFTKFVTL